jgi:hypothetical protein
MQIDFSGLEMGSTWESRCSSIARHLIVAVHLDYFLRHEWQEPLL